MNPQGELRCYTFTLTQLRTMQQGIQAAHAIVELSVATYGQQVQKLNPEPFRTYLRWATEWKTMICLDGGDVADLCELRDFLADIENPYPCAVFYESEAFLAGCLTSVAIILPHRIFNTAEILRKRLAPADYPQKFSDWELQLIDRLVEARKAT